MEPGLVHFPTPRCHSRWITISLWNSWEESTRSCVHSIPRPAHASVMFIALGTFQKHLSIKQKTRQFNCLMGLCDFPKKKRQEHGLLYKCTPDATRYKPSNYQRLGMAWSNTDSAQQTHPGLDFWFKRIYPVPVPFVFERMDWFKSSPSALDDNLDQLSSSHC